MLNVVVVLAALGFFIGALLGVASSRLSAEESPVVQEIEAILPGSQCAQCGFAGCSQAAQAIASHSAPVSACPPGGPQLARKIATILGVDFDPASVAPVVPRVAVVGEQLCIGCTKCYRACPTDAIVGAPKQIHFVLAEFCTACGLCVDACPTETVQLHEKQLNLDEWRWPKPNEPSETKPAPRAA